MYLCNLTRKNADDLVMPNVRVFDYDSRVMTARNLLSKGTQTDYRDSETQTIPWEPPYKLALGSKEPEVLGLENLSWGSGLPVGTDELKIIKRMRVKKSWESLLPPLDCKVNVQTHKAIITMIDRDEWSFRDKELEMMMDERLEWINKVIKTNNYQRKKKIIQRFEKLGKYLNQLRNKRINEIKRELNREIRKISAKHLNKNSKFIKNPGAKTTDLKDECLFRFKLDDESFYDSLLNRKTLQDKKDPMSYLTRVNHINQLNDKKTDELCLRETRWTDDMLKNLHIDLKNIRLNTASKWLLFTTFTCM